MSSTGRGPDGHVIGVVLHVVEGRLREWDVFDGDAGEGVTVDLDSATALEVSEIG